MSRENGSASTIADRQFCESVLPGVSRTFALSIALLPRPLRDSVGTAYLLCRIVDCIEDEHALDPHLRHLLFDELDRLIADDGRDPGELEERSAQLDLGSGPDERMLMRGAGAVFRCYRDLSRAEREAIRPHVMEMSSGMRDFASRDGLGRIRDLDELEQYCYYVAGTVGKLLTGLFSLDIGAQATSERHTRAVRFGLGLQLVNVIRDVCDDASRGVSFLPAAVADAQGVDVGQMLDPAHRTAALEVVQVLRDRAFGHLAVAEDYCLEWPREGAAHIRLFCAVPLALALATLAMFRAEPERLLSPETPKISRAAVTEATRRARDGQDSDEALKALFHTARAGELHLFGAA